MLFNGLHTLVGQWALIKSAQGSVARVCCIMEQTEEKYDGENIEKLDSAFHLDNVSVEIAGRKIIDGLNMIIPEKGKVAIVGASGSGKTTLLNTLIRFFEPSEGKISTDGNDVMSFGLKAYRSRFAYVSQEIPLFNETLRYNLCYGIGEDMTDEELKIACEKANLSSFLENHETGLDMLISENGGNLSGGEKQRIAIARAMLKKPDIVLLDEATSNLDAESENEVLTALENLSENASLIMVAHHLSIIKDAAVIFVLDRGRLVAQGTHEELLVSCERYKGLDLADRMMWERGV